MCEFCTEHGEGKKWYLQMKNYTAELLHEELTAQQRHLTGAESRYEWSNAFWQYFIMPAINGAPAEWPAPSEGQVAATPPSEADILARRKVEHFGQVLPMEDVERVIDMADSITRMPCGCRFMTTGQTDKRYCFGFGLDKWGVLGKYPETSTSLEVLDKAEAKKIFHKFDEEGLIHSIWTGVTPFVVGLCNCDHDCGAYKGYIERRGPPHFFRAEYVCQVDWDLCNGCRACMAQCQFASQFYSSALGKVYIDPTRCFGCGVCRTACPSEAITLIPRQEVPAAANIWLKDPAVENG